MGLFGNVGKSVAGFFGADNGDKAPAGQFGSLGLRDLQGMNSVYNSPNARAQMNEYAQGKMSLNDMLNASGEFKDPGAAQGYIDMLASDPLTGSKLATEQVQSSPLFGQLFGQGGALSSALSKEQELQNKGFQLTPEDQEMYGQASGNIARLFGQQEQSAAQSLADRGLAAAPSGAAGALFSGLAGNKNEQLARAQMNIMQNRFQNTMQRIQQQQQFAAQLGGQAQTAVQSQFGRNQAGVEGRRQGLMGQAQLEQSQNNAQNKYNMDAAQFNAANKPVNIGDYAAAGVGSGVYNMSGGAFNTLFSGKGKEATSGGGGMGSGASAALGMV